MIKFQLLIRTALVIVSLIITNLAYAAYTIGNDVPIGVGINHADQLKASRFQANGNGSVQYMLFYNFGIPGDIRLAIYSHHGGNRPLTLLAEGGPITPSLGWCVVSLGSSVNIVNGQYYWLVLQSTNSTRTVYRAITPSVGEDGLWVAQPYGAFPATFPSSGLTYDNVVGAIYATDTNPLPPTLTVTKTGTPTATVTPTPTKTETITYTVTPSHTQSATYTDTPTVTPTYTISLTPTPSPTFTITSTATFTATITPSATITQTSTQSPVLSPTATPTSSSSSTMTPTPTITLTLTVTPYLSHTVSPTTTITATISPTPTTSATVTITRSRTPTPKITATVTLIPEVLEFVGAYPVPATGDAITFQYQLASAGKVSIEVFNITGEKIETLRSEQSTSGRYHLQWSIKDVAPGVYLYHIKLTSNSGDIKQLPIKKLLIEK